MKPSPLCERIWVTPDGRAFLDGKNEMTYNGAPGWYLFVRFRTPGKRHQLYVHRLVAAAYCDGYEPELWVNHLDGNKRNNNADNLEWCTPQQNSTHAVEHGIITAEGVNHPKVKLSEGDVIDAFTSVRSGESQRSVAARLGISPAQINHIVRGRQWRRLLRSFDGEIVGGK